MVNLNGGKPRLPPRWRKAAAKESLAQLKRGNARAMPTGQSAELPTVQMPSDLG